MGGKEKKTDNGCMWKKMNKLENEMKSFNDGNQQKKNISPASERTG